MKKTSKRKAVMESAVQPVESEKVAVVPMVASGLDDQTASDKGVDFQHVPVSHLEPLPRGFRLSGDELFLVSQPVMKDGKTAGYVSKSIKYSTLARNISADMKFGVKEDDGYRGIVQYVKDVVKDPEHPIPSVISSIAEDSNGRITGISGYALENAVKEVFHDVVLPNMDGIVLTSQVTSEMGNRTDLVASQKLAEHISSQFGQFVRKDQITQVAGDSATLVASQRLVGSLSSSADQTFIRKSDVRSVPGSSTTCPASQKFVTDISGVVVKSAMRNLSGWWGDVYYISADNIPVMRSMLDISDYVCENQNDIDRTITYMDDFFSGEQRPKSSDCSVDLKSGDCGYVFSPICEGGDVPNLSDSISVTCVMGKDMVPKSICINTVGNCTGDARMIGLLTREKLANYSITLDEFAGNDIQSGQDQVYGFVAAHAIDEDGNHHSIIFSRNVDDDGNNGWMVAVDGIGRTDPRTGRLVWKSKTVSSIGDQTVGNRTLKLNDPNARSTLHVTRRGNKIFAYVSSVHESRDKLPPQYIDKSTELVIDLESQTAFANGQRQSKSTGMKDSGLLRLFLGEAEAGFVVMSSSGGKYANCKYADVTGDVFTRRLRHANWYPNIRIPVTDIPEPDVSAEAMFLFKELTPSPPSEYNPPPEYVYIIDAENNVTYMRQVGKRTYGLTAVTDMDPMNHVGVGRFALNRATNKTFFVTETGFVKVMEYDDD